MFSIIIPTYNHGKYLGRAIESVIAQTCSDWELVIVNDGSTDNTSLILEEYSIRDPRIRTFHKPNGGTASAINMGLANSHGEWVCWLSSDDWFEPDKLDIHKRYIEKYPNCMFFFSHFHMFDEFNNKFIDRELFGPLPDRELQIPVLFYRNYVMGVGICANKKIFDQVGEMDEDLKYAQDYDMWLRILTSAPGMFIPERTFTYRHHPGQGSETFQLACLFDASKAGIRYLNTHPYEELFPLLDLSNKEAAVKALEKTLEVASDPSSYIYSLGPHPAILLRVVEWIQKKELNFQDRLIQVVQEYGTFVNHKYSNTRFGNIWKASLNTMSNMNECLTYVPISHIAVALDNYFHYVVVKYPLSQPLRTYLEIYENISLGGIQPSAYYSSLPQGELDRFLRHPNIDEILSHSVETQEQHSHDNTFFGIISKLKKRNRH